MFNSKDKMTISMDNFRKALRDEYANGKNSGMSQTAESIKKALQDMGITDISIECDGRGVSIRRIEYKKLPDIPIPGAVREEDGKIYPGKRTYPPMAQHILPPPAKPVDLGNKVIELFSEAVVDMVIKHPEECKQIIAGLFPLITDELKEEEKLPVKAVRTRKQPEKKKAEPVTVASMVDQGKAEEVPLTKKAEKPTH